MSENESPKSAPTVEFVYGGFLICFVVIAAFTFHTHALFSELKDIKRGVDSNSSELYQMEIRQKKIQQDLRYEIHHTEGDLKRHIDHVATCKDREHPHSKKYRPPKDLFK